ncbi:MAG TPA: hypothetical protein PKC83_17275 [Gemmatimonadaceae bacterium]|nr:hypothetical protein [Gemmatimonadaceae bacterium]
MVSTTTTSSRVKPMGIVRDRPLSLRHVFLQLENATIPPIILA